MDPDPTLYRNVDERNIPEMKLRGLVPNFHIHVSVSDLYIPEKFNFWEYINQILFAVYL